MKKLLANGALVDARDNVTCGVKVFSNLTFSIHYLSQQAPFVKTRSVAIHIQTGKTSLSLAVAAGKLKIVEALLEKNANINAPDKVTATE